MNALTQSLALWYFTRGSGAISLVLLTLVFALGTPTVVSWGHEHFPRAVVLLVHRNLSLLVVVFVFLHVATTVIDGFAPIGWLDAIIPFRAGYRPLWLGLGAVTVDLLLAVIITSLMRVRLGYRNWQRVHLLSYAMWPIAMLHGLGTGSDTRFPWMWIIDGSCAAIALASVAWRLKVWRPVDPRQRSIAIGALVLVPALVIGWTMIGPMKPNWSKRAASVDGTHPVEHIVERSAA
ncbi:MAG: ferric reductase [Ilumatobacteraceae bacterium]|nr:ferric reductase [Ilumatobacteraceae bacterium]